MNRYLKFILKLGASTLLIFLLLRKVDLGEIVTVIKNFEPYYVLILLIGMIIGFLITYSSLVVFFRVHKRFRFLKYFRSYLLSLSIGLLSPAKIGDFSLAYFIKDDFPPGKGLSIVFLNKVITITLMLLLGIIGIYFIISKEYAVILAFILIACFLFGLLFLKYSKKILFKILPVKSHIHLKEFYSTMLDFLYNHKKRIIIAYSIMFIKFCIDSLIAYFLLSKLGVNTSFLFVLFAYSISVASALIPITLNGIGIREVAIAYLFKSAGLNPVIGASTFFVIVMTHYLLTALFPLLYSKKNKLQSPILRGY